MTNLRLPTVFTNNNRLNTYSKFKKTKNKSLIKTKWITKNLNNNHHWIKSWIETGMHLMETRSLWFGGVGFRTEISRCCFALQMAVVVANEFRGGPAVCEWGRRKGLPFFSRDSCVFFRFLLGVVERLFWICFGNDCVGEGEEAYPLNPYPIFFI